MSADKATYSAGANVPHFTVSQLLSSVRYIQLPMTELMIQYESFVGYDERGSPRLWEKEEESSFLEKGREDRFWDVVIENRSKKLLHCYFAVTKYCSSLLFICELSFKKKFGDGICKGAYI